MSRLVVISGASSGIGRAAALRFARAGFHVVAVARGKDKLDALVEEAKGREGTIEAEAVDAADGDAVVAMASRVLERCGVPAVLINSAGAGRWIEIEDTSPKELNQMMSAPFQAAFHLCHAFVGSMRARGKGIILHINSPASIQPWPGSTAYACARWALRGLHEALRVDLHGTGVHSCHVIFGEVSSEYFDNNPGSHERVPAITKVIPVLSPAQCAETLFRLAHRPVPEVCEPLVLRALMMSHGVAPGLTRAITTRTGRKR